MIVEELVLKLKKNNLRISSLESCTGGHLIDQITNVEGASDITNGGLVAYSNSQKIKAGIPAGVIEKYGVYSIECAQAMSGLGLELFSSDICIGITGTLSNIDTKNKDSQKGRVFYSIKIRLDNQRTSLEAEILVPPIERSSQKSYIANIIFKRLNGFLESYYMGA